MRKGSKKKTCECCGDPFMAQADKLWSTIDKKCYIRFYLPFRDTHSVKDLSGHWNEVKAYVINLEKEKAKPTINNGNIYGSSSRDDDCWD